MPISCDRCKLPSIIFIRYSGQHLCSIHFLDLIRRRVKKEMRFQKVFVRGRRVGIAVSGGKDSLLLLKLVNEVSSKLKAPPPVAITIDEGISGYRQSSVDLVKKVVEGSDIELKILSFIDLYGKTMDELVIASGMGPCSICGILRRKSLNQGAVETGCGILLTGHNLDDTAQTIFMNILQADVNRLARLGPHLDPIDGFIPRAMPLRTTPETETYLSAVLLGLPIHGLECPYSRSAKRGHYRDLILKLEEETPGTRHSLLRFHDQVAPLIPRAKPNTIPCSRCGEPIIENEGEAICRSCSIMGIL